MFPGEEDEEALKTSLLLGISHVKDGEVQGAGGNWTRIIWESVSRKVSP